jgi:hypothetical protein
MGVPDMHAFHGFPGPRDTRADDRPDAVLLKDGKKAGRSGRLSVAAIAARGCRSAKRRRRDDPYCGV